MAMAGGQQGISLSDLQSQLSAGKSSSGGGDEEQSDFADFITKALAGKVSLVAKLSGGALPNMADPENAAPTKMFDSQGPTDKKIQGLAVLATNQGNFIWRAIKMLFSNRAITDFTAGVGGDLYASLGSLVESFAPSIPIESLGSISAQTFASAAPSIGAGMEIG